MSAMRALLPRLLPLGTRLVRVMPYTVARAAAVSAALMACLLQRSRREAVLENLSHLAPGLSNAARRRLTRATFRNFALIWLDTLRLPSMSRGEFLALIDAEANDRYCALVNAALAEGHGALVLSAHLGAVDLSGALTAAWWPTTTVAEEIAPEMFDMLRRYRSATGLRVLPQSRSALGVVRALSRGEVVAVLVDRAIAGQAAEVELCGSRRLMPTGPAALALKTGAPIVLACLVAQPTARSRYTPVARRLEAATRDPVALTREIGAALGDIIRQYPDQWFVFQRNCTPS
jgi:KDO2-lipid IV(A) lauroyltransferase